MRTEDHGGLNALELVQGAVQVQTTAQPRLRCMPEPAPIEPGLREVHKTLTRQTHALGFGPLRKTQPQVTQDHVPAAAHQRVKQPSECRT